MLISNDFELKNCKSCGKQFQSYWVRGGKALRCPTCQDIKQGRPSVVVDRGIEFIEVCAIDSLPTTWEPFQATKDDLACWKMSKKGSEYGVVWDGRIDIYSHDRILPKKGDVCLFEKCVSVHRREDMLDRPLEIREYYRLTTLPNNNQSSLPKLVWLTASWKTTIKGFGCQYKRDLIGSPLWEHRISGQVRSGRLGTVGALALTDKNHPLAVKEVFDC